MGPVHPAKKLGKDRLARIGLGSLGGHATTGFKTVKNNHWFSKNWSSIVKQVSVAVLLDNFVAASARMEEQRRHNELQAEPCTHSHGYNEIVSKVEENLYPFPLSCAFLSGRREW